MLTIKGLFFDLDGTLCNTDEALYESYSRAFAAEGYDISHLGVTAYIERTNGLSSREFIPLLAPGIEAAAAGRIREAKAKIYPEVVHMVKPNQQLIDFLRVMAPLHTTALVTTAQESSGDAVLRQAGITDLFQYKIYGSHVTHAKPHPEAYLKALELTSLSPDEAIAFEDSDSGVTAATQAGLRVIKVARP